MPNGETTIGEELIRPTELYVKPIVALFEKEYNINGLAHITGGGFTNLRRLKKGVGYDINNLPEVPEIFKLIYEQNVDIKEMYKVFNMGVGFVVICDESEADKIMETLKEYGMVPDEYQYEGEIIGNYGPYIQSERKEIYQAFIKYFIEIGRAYPCFCSKENLNDLREKQNTDKVRTGYYGEYASCKNLSIDEYIDEFNKDRRYTRYRSRGSSFRRFYSPYTKSK
jgi:hypothetical protein